MKIFECLKLAKLGTTITIGFSEKVFLFICCEQEDEAGIHVRTFFITKNDLLNPKRWLGSNSEKEKYEYNVNVFKRLFQKFGYWCSYDSNTQRGFNEILQMLQTDNYTMYKLIKNCDFTTDITL